MSFLVSVLWALLTFANTGFGHTAAPGAASAPAAIGPVHGFHHAEGGMRPMDTNGGGPTAPAPAPSPSSST